MNHDFKVGDLVTYKLFNKKVGLISRKHFEDIKEIGIVTQDNEEKGILILEWVKTDYEGLNPMTTLSYDYAKLILQLIHI
jgi:hypothetical protein